MLSERFTRFQEHLRATEDPAYESDLASFSQVGNIRLMVSKTLRRVLNLHMESGAEEFSTQNSKVEMPDCDQDSQKVLLESSSHSLVTSLQPLCAHSVAQYLDSNWSQDLAYTYYAMELGKLAEAHDVSVQEVLATAER